MDLQKIMEEDAQGLGLLQPRAQEQGHQPLFASFASGPNPIISCLGIHAIVRSTLDPAGPPVLLYLSLHMSVSRVLDIRTFCNHHKTVLENHSQEGEAERSNTSRTIHPANPWVG